VQSKQKGGDGIDSFDYSNSNQLVDAMQIKLAHA
jgi:hypothetical protein